MFVVNISLQWKDCLGRCKCKYKQYNMQYITIQYNYAYDADANAGAAKNAPALKCGQKNAAALRAG